MFDLYTRNIVGMARNIHLLAYVGIKKQVCHNYKSNCTTFKGLSIFYLGNFKKIVSLHFKIRTCAQNP